MRIAFVSQLDPGNVNVWSGTPYFIVDALRARGHDVVPIGPLNPPSPRVLKSISRTARVLSGKDLDLSRSPRVAAGLARQAGRLLGQHSVDIVLTSSSILGSSIATDTPLVTWEDATFAGMLDYYPGKWSNFARTTIAHGNLLQQRSLNKATLSVFASDWAARSALEHYLVDRAKIHVIPFGANLQEVPAASEVEAAVVSRLAHRACRLLFVGVEWERKGGDLVLATAALLRAQGIEVSVDVVGCTPPRTVPDFVRLHGFVSKSTEAGRQKVKRLFLDASYLMVPSLAECYGLVFAEASAFGVPSLARATGGIPTVVSNGVNGFTFSIDSPAEAYADHIRAEWSDPEIYAAAARSSRRLFEEKLSWDVAVAGFEELVAPLGRSR
jgi:glycosyltransferase involved in cell wall biosynthesis